MSADELVAEMREITKKLLGYGARAPKELMLFVKNMMFLNSATAILAPDLDMLQQMMAIYMYFARDARRAHHARGRDRRAATPTPDPDAMKAAFMVDSDVDTLTFRDLQARRDEVRRKLQRQRERPTRGGPSAARRGEARCPSSRRCRRWPSASTPRSPARRSRRVEPLGFSALKTVVPAPESLVGRDGRARRPAGEVPRPRLRRRRAASSCTSRRPGASTSRSRRSRPRAKGSVCGCGFSNATAPAVARARVRPRAQGGVVGARARRRRPARAPRPRARLRRVRRADPPRRRPPPRAHAAARPAHGVGRRPRLRRRRAVARAALAVRVARVARRRRSGRACSTRCAA